jgi:hypothetical protein
MPTRFALLALFLRSLGPPLDQDKELPVPWVVASGQVDVDRDGVPDSIRIETSDPKRSIDEEPCAGCGDRVEGHFEAVVTLSRTHRTVRTPVALHPKIVDTMWFWHSSASDLAIADYNGDGRPDFNLGQFTNSVKWEYGLYTIQRDGRVRQFALDHPEIYVSPGDAPSTERIEVIPGGMRFHDFGNAGVSPGWWVFTCLWRAERGEFRCSGKPD